MSDGRWRRWFLRDVSILVDRASFGGGILALVPKMKKLRLSRCLKHCREAIDTRIGRRLHMALCRR